MLKTVISASRRTDIPAFYLKWFIEQIRQGWVDVANPLYRKQVRRVNLSPQKVSWIVFWSRDYRHFLKRRLVFDDYRLFFHFTILSPSIMEKSSFPIIKAIEQAELIAQYYGGDHIVWRYDPIVFWRENSGQKSNFNKSGFNFLCKKLSALEIERCYSSIAHPYRKFLQRFHKKFTALNLPDANEKEENAVISDMVQIASSYGITLYACCTNRLLQIPGVNAGSCIDGRLLNRLHPAEKVSAASRPTRAECRCTHSIDVGDYQRHPCPAGCIYCYGNPIC